MSKEIFFDTLLFENGILDNIENHYQRFVITNDALGGNRLIDSIDSNDWYHFELPKILKNNLKRVRVGFLKDAKNGWISTLRQEELPIYPEQLTLCFHDEAIVNSYDKMLNYKLSDSIHHSFMSNNQIEANDVIFINEDGFICETSRANIYYEMDGLLFTPPCSDGVMAGTFRQQLLNTNKVIDKSITKKELSSNMQIYISNSLMGFRKAVIINYCF